VVLPISEVRRIVERVCARQDVLDACAERDLGYVIAAFEEGGLTQGQMASLTGLHQNRLSDYVFDWKRMVAFEGNTGPYLQYAHARIHSIFGKASRDGGTAAGATKEPFLFFIAASLFFVVFSAITMQLSALLERRFARGIAEAKA